MGRIGIYEVMEITGNLRRMIHRAARRRMNCEQQVHDNGGLLLRDEAVQVALMGKSSLEEVLRVTQNGDDITDEFVAE